MGKDVDSPQSGKGLEVGDPLESNPLGGNITRAVRKGPDGKEVQVLVDRASAEASARKFRYINKTTPKYLIVLKKVTKEVKAGQYKNRKEAERALFNVQRDFVKANPPPKSR